MYVFSLFLGAAQMDIKSHSPQYIIKCKHCNGYITHSLYIDHIRIEYQFGIKIKQYVVGAEYCNSFTKPEKTVCCNNCQKVIGIVGFSNRKFPTIRLSTIRFIYDVLCLLIRFSFVFVFILGRIFIN